MTPVWWWSTPPGPRGGPPAAHDAPTLRMPMAPPLGHPHQALPSMLLPPEGSSGPPSSEKGWPLLLVRAAWWGGRGVSTPSGGDGGPPPLPHALPVHAERHHRHAHAHEEHHHPPMAPWVKASTRTHLARLVEQLGRAVGRVMVGPREGPPAAKQRQPYLGIGPLAPPLGHIPTMSGSLSCLRRLTHG